MALKIINPLKDREWRHPKDQDFVIRYRIDADKLHALAVKRRSELQAFEELLKESKENGQDQEAPAVQIGLDERLRGQMEFVTDFLATVIVSWKGMQDADGGEEIEYRRELLPSLLPYIGEFVIFVYEQIQKHFAGIRQTVEGHLGNLPGASGTKS